MLDKAYIGVFGYPPSEHKLTLEYNNRFSPYNANIKRRGNDIYLYLSSSWKDVDEDIQVGLIQSLLIKLFKKKMSTDNVELYTIFIKKLAQFTPTTLSDPLLSESFARVNEKYFFSLVEIPNLKWGKFSKTILGHYNYNTNTITISSILKSAPLELVDYVMYHELLHKKHKFYTINNRHYHHTSSFKNDELAFSDSENMEYELTKFVRRSRKKGFFDSIFG